MELSTLTEYLFFHLYKSSPITGQPCPLVNIPCTLFFRWAQPFFFYWTDASGKIKRINKDKIDLENVKQKVGRANNEIMARWMYASGYTQDKEQLIAVEYLGEKNLGRPF